MSSPKGYGSGSKLDRISSQFSTVEPVRTDQYGLSVLAHQFLFQVASLAVTSATTSVITAAAHGALKGDVIRFTSGVYSGREVKVYSVTVNTITLMEDLATAPAAADTFLVTRHKYPMTDSSGNIQCTFSYTLNGASQTVIRDTTVPANNRPLPVEMLDSGGNSISTTLSGAFVIQDVILRNSSGVEKGTNANPISVAGTVASGAADSGNPVKAGGVYNSAAPTFTNGQRGDLQLDASGRLQTLATQSGNWDIRNITGTVSLPTGAATSALQGTGNTSLASIDGKIVTCNTGAVVISSSALPAGAATESTLSAMSGKLPATLGQKAMAASMSVALSSDQSAIPVSQSGTWNVTNISGTVSLPTGAATSALQTALNAQIPATLGQKAMAAALAVSIASDQSAIPASQSGTWTVQPGNTPNTTAWLMREAGKAFANAPVRNDYTSTAITTSGYVQLVASTTSLTSEIEIFDSSGQTLALAVGGVGSEVNQIYIFPGGNGRIPLAIPAGSRVSLKAISATANAGELDINFYGV
jgi:hypothetical protein